MSQLRFAFLRHSKHYVTWTYHNFNFFLTWGAICGKDCEFLKLSKLCVQFVWLSNPKFNFSVSDSSIPRCQEAIPSCRDSHLKCRDNHLKVWLSNLKFTFSVSDCGIPRCHPSCRTGMSKCRLKPCDSPGSTARVEKWMEMLSKMQKSFSLEENFFTA